MTDMFAEGTGGRDPGIFDSNWDDLSASPLEFNQLRKPSG